MALRSLQTVIANNYAKLSTDPVLAGDIVGFDTSATSTAVNPAGVSRVYRSATFNSTALYRGNIVGVCADDALGTNPSGETVTMINNDPAGSNFVNGNAFQSYTAGFYVGVKRAIGDYRDQSIDFVSNLTAGVPTYSQRGVSVYTTPSSQFVTDRFALLQSSGSTTVDSAYASGFVVGDLLTVGALNGNAAGTGFPSQPTLTNASTSTNNSGLLVKLTNTDAPNSSGGYPTVGRVDWYDSGAGLLYWTLL